MGINAPQFSSYAEIDSDGSLLKMEEGR
jgi:hypothetical protein